MSNFLWLSGNIIYIIVGNVDVYITWGKFYMWLFSTTRETVVIHMWYVICDSYVYKGLKNYWRMAFGHVRGLINTTGWLTCFMASWSNDQNMLITSIFGMALLFVLSLKYRHKFYKTFIVPHNWIIISNLMWSFNIKE